MRKAIVYAFICIYSFALLKPVMPIANDIIAHTFYKMEHLATVHFENGKYHVHQELAANDTKDNSKGTSPSVYETLASHYVSASIALFGSPSCIELKVNTPPVKHLPDGFAQNATPPPEA